MVFAVPAAARAGRTGRNGRLGDGAGFENRMFVVKNAQFQPFGMHDIVKQRFPVAHEPIGDQQCRNRSRIVKNRMNGNQKKSVRFFLRALLQSHCGAILGIAEKIGFERARRFRVILRCQFARRGA